MKILEMMGHELLTAIQNGDLQIEEIMSFYLERIEKLEEKIKAFITISKEAALDKARQYDKELLKENKIGRLLGLPIAIKDCICVKDSPTTCGSQILQGYKPPFNATVVEKLIEQENAICIGRTNMDEFAMGSSTENSYYGPTHNPWDLNRVPGGSSGGSAAAIAACQASFALGSDTGGSVRGPASYCGVVGLKPTYGIVSRNGLVSYANSLEQIGPITRCVKDSALLLEMMAGKDDLDSTTVNQKVENYTEILDDSIENIKMGIPKQFFGESIQEEVKKSVNDSIKQLETMGIESVEINFPNIEYVIPSYYLIGMSEASSNLARFDGLRYGKISKNLEGDVFDVFNRTRGEFFGSEVRRRIILGTYALSAGYYDMFYLKALKVRTIIKQDFKNAFEQCSAIACPTMPTTAFKLGELIDDPLQMYMMDILTCPINLAGLPAISIPCGVDSDNLPIGFQIIGDYFKEGQILTIAHQLEQKLNIFRKIPNVSGGM